MKVYSTYCNKSNQKSHKEKKNKTSIQLNIQAFTPGAKPPVIIRPRVQTQRTDTGDMNATNIITDAWNASLLNTRFYSARPLTTGSFQ